MYFRDIERDPGDYNKHNESQKKAAETRLKANAEFKARKRGRKPLLAQAKELD